MEGASVLLADRLSGEDADFREIMERQSDFAVRRAVERLREGLFDPVAVRLLTAHEERLQQEMIRGIEKLERGERPHLCLLGAYGQGKSHSLLYLQEQALRQGFATSFINLDPREIPFHNFREVYRELMRRLRFPDPRDSFSLLWKRWARERLSGQADSGNGVAELFPQGMPHLFQCVLAAMIQGNASSSPGKKGIKKGEALHPRDIAMLLERALEGEAIPVHRLKNVLDHQQVSFHREASLACRGVEPFWEMIQALSRLFRQMGLRGWVLLFDEGESIVQGNVSARSVSYRILHRMLFSADSRDSLLFPVFAFTDDFFHRVREEDYQRRVIRRGAEIPLFDRNYAEEWGQLNICRLGDLSRREWELLAHKLLCLHARAYRWQPPVNRTTRELDERLEATRNQETRLRLKALVDCLDLVQQEQNTTPR